MSRTTLMQQIHLVTLFDLDLMYISISSLVWGYLNTTLSIPWEVFWRTLGSLLLLVSPVSGANKAKRDNFDFWADIDLICNIFKI